MAYEKYKTDTVNSIFEWKETLTIKRATVTYNASGISSSSWETIGTFLGDWQPATGVTMRNESGLAVKSGAVILAPTTANVLVGDRVYRSDNTYMNVTHVWEFEDHKTIHLSITEES